MREVTLYTAANGSLRSVIRSDNGSYICLEDWGHWKPSMNTYETTVQDKLFDPESGDERIYGPVKSMDRFIDNINNHSALLDKLGDTTSREGSYTETFTVLSIETTTITVPFFGNTVSVDRIVKYVSGTGESEYLAFTIDEQPDDSLSYDDVPPDGSTAALRYFREAVQS